MSPLQGGLLGSGRKDFAFGYLSKVQTWANLPNSQSYNSQNTRSGQCPRSLSGSWTDCLWLLVQGPDMGKPPMSESQNTKRMTHLALAIGGRRDFGRQSKAMDEVQFELSNNFKSLSGAFFCHQKHTGQIYHQYWMPSCNFGRNLKGVGGKRYIAAVLNLILNMFKYAKFVFKNV